MVKSVVYTINNFIGDDNSRRVTDILRTKFTISPFKILSIKKITYEELKSVVRISKIPNSKSNLDRLKKFLFRISNSPCDEGLWMLTPDVCDEDVEVIKKLYLLTNFE